MGVICVLGAQGVESGEAGAPEEAGRERLCSLKEEIGVIRFTLWKDLGINVGAGGGDGWKTNLL